MAKCLAYGETKSSGRKASFFGQYFIKKLEGGLGGSLFYLPAGPL